MGISVVHRKPPSLVVRNGVYGRVAASPAAPARWWEAALLPKRWTPVLLLVVVGLLASSLLVSIVVRGMEADFVGLDSLARWFDVNKEMGIPAWFSTMLLFLCAQALWGLSEESAAGPRSRWVVRERLLAVVFVALSVDELLSFHEMLNEPLRQAYGFDGVLRFAWVVVAVPFLLVLGIFMVGYLRALPRVVLRLFLLSGALYVGGAAGFELIGAGIWSSGGEESLAYSVATVFEEGLEMIGLVVFLGTVSWYRRALAGVRRPHEVTVGARPTVDLRAERPARR